MGYTSENIRNIALLGHGGCGKTTFIEAALLKTGETKKLGSIEDGSTVSDYDKMEIEKGYSINTSVVPVEWENCKINFVDAPGYYDFIGEVRAALRAAEAGIILVDSEKGIEVGTEEAWDICEDMGKPRFFVITQKEGELDLDGLIGQLKDKFGEKLIPFTWPVIEHLDEEVKEAIAMADENLMEKYFNDEEFTDEEIITSLEKGIKTGEVVPVITTPFKLDGNLEDILNLLVRYVPTPLEHPVITAINGSDEEVQIQMGPEGKPSAFVVKTIIDPFVGKISLMKVVTGTLKNGLDLYNSRSGKTERLGKLFFMSGKKQKETTSAAAGDIVAVAKLQNTVTGDTLSSKDEELTYSRIAYPLPTYYIAIEAEDKANEEKMGLGLTKLREEDPSFVLERNVETHQSLLGGQGDIQLNIIQAKLKDRFGVTVKAIPQKIAYRETIKGNSDVQGKHKKQSGGAGQYGDVHIRFSPSQQEFEFDEELFGGSVPKNYVPAVEKGLQESMEKGPLAGCKVVNVKAVLYDGSYHEVDSSDMAFKIAASLAFKKGIKEASPCLLEPVMHMEIYVPDAHMGDVMGDMSKRRGKILGMEPAGEGKQKLMAEAPQSELFDYALGLRAMTQGRGKFEMTFERYDEVPKETEMKIVEAYQASRE